MRFVHVADIHLDTSFAGRSEAVRRRLREASREAFGRAVDLAIREDVNAFLIGGDLFDGDRLSFQTERFLLEQTARLGDHGVTVVYATGNHDPGSPEKGPRPLPWPKCVRVAPDATPRRFLIQDRSGEPVGYVTAVGHATAQERDDLSRTLPRPEGDLPEVGLLHTQVHSSIGARDHHPYAPSELTYLLRAGYDYWALGHVHVRQELSADPPIWYSGSLQGKSHADRGERGALLVDLSARAAPAITFRSLAPVRWDTLEVDRLEGITSLDELERHVQVAWRAARTADPGGNGTEWMARVVLNGPCPLWAELRTAEDRNLLAGELREILGVLDVACVTDGVHPVVSIAEHRLRTDVLGEVLRLTEAVRQGDERLSQLDRSTLVGFTSDDSVELGSYVRRLLEGAEGELAARLFEDGSS
ncbi:MAG: DNA repair exonuclease [Gemmatimonadetes bacterium]|nr:DNA repair exonuclease [Gemmatimonadota bacterium]MDA1102517.1 DNA repair exonuclease [Gemmatimonadota bacterium]